MGLLEILLVNYGGSELKMCQQRGLAYKGDEVVGDSCSIEGAE